MGEGLLTYEDQDCEECPNESGRYQHVFSHAAVVCDSPEEHEEDELDDHGDESAGLCDTGGPDLHPKERDSALCWVPVSDPLLTRQHARAVGLLHACGIGGRGRGGVRQSY